MGDMETYNNKNISGNYYKTTSSQAIRAPMMELKLFSDKLFRALRSMSDEELEQLEYEADSVYYDKASSPFEIFVLGYELGQQLRNKQGHVFMGAVDDRAKGDVRTFFFVGTEYEILNRFTKVVLLTHSLKNCG